MTHTKKLVITALCIAIGIVLPTMLHGIPNAGSIFLPLHFTVLICGLTCGAVYGGISGVLTTLLSHMMTGMPPAFILPSMICELATYGIIAGFMYDFIKVRNKNTKIVVSLVSAMLLGRIVYGLLNAILFQVGTYNLNIWMTSMFITALPGIIVQLLLIPFVVRAIEKIK